VWNDGLVHWANWHGSGDDTEKVKRWTIDIDGMIDYIEREPINEWENANPGSEPWEYPAYTAGYFWDQETPGTGVGYEWPAKLTNILGHYVPQCGCPQADMFVGKRWQYGTLPDYPDPEDFPFEFVDQWFNTLDFSVTIELNAGPMTYDDYGFPKVDGATIWSKEFIHYHLVGGSDPRTGYSGAGDPKVGIDQFDAAPGTSATIFKYRYYTTWTQDDELIPGDFPVYSPNEFEENTIFNIDGTDIDEVLIESSSTDLTAYYPRWINPRVLHLSEADQGGKQRVAVFQRVPFGP
jgi:hypothetical protein